MTGQLVMAGAACLAMVLPVEFEVLGVWTFRSKGRSRGDLFLESKLAR